MFNNAANILLKNKDVLALKVKEWIQNNFPNRTLEYDKCSRDVSYIIKALSYSLNDNTSYAVDHLASMFYTQGIIK